MEEEYHKKFTHRRTIDHGNTFSRWIIESKTGVLPTNSLISYNNRTYQHGLLSRTKPDASYIADILPPLAYKSASSITSLPTKFVHTSVNKIKHPVLVTVWTPDGRRLLTGSMSGEFTLWNGMTFNFETIMQAHDNAIRTMVYSNNGEWLLSGDQDGQIKYWQSNFNNVNILNAHREAIRDISFCPNDSKFVTGSDDGTLKVWNFNDSSKEEVTLTGHGWDVKCCDWHPTLGLIASGSKDNSIKLWDPRNGGKCLSTLHSYKNTVTKMKFQRTGSTQMLLASVSRDHTGRIFDLRMMRDLLVLRGHTSDVYTLAWHPIHSDIITTGTHDGSISHFKLNTILPENTTSLEPILRIPNAHDWPIWSLSYHPLGHILSSASNDKSTRFWCRPRPGDETAFDDKYYHEEEKLQQGGQQSSTISTQIPYQAPSSSILPPGLSQSLPGIPGLSSFT